MPHPPPAFIDQPPLRRYGLPELVFAASPAAATDFTQVNDGNFLARLISVFCRLVTDANVAAREVVLEYRDSQNLRYDLMGIPVTVAASSTNDYLFSAYEGQGHSPSDATLIVPLHPVLLRPSDNFRLHVVNVQAADQLSRIRFVWERFYSDVYLPGLDPAER